MSQYVQQSDLSGLIPSEFFTQALDDTNSGSINAALFNQIAVDASGLIDSYLGTRFAVPFTTPYPVFVVNAAKKLVAEQLYKRRGVADDKNPFSDEAKQLRSMMVKMAQGEFPLDPGMNRLDPAASIVTLPIRTVTQAVASGMPDRLNV